jgi:hypothetical protein
MGFEALAHWDMNIQKSFDSTFGNKDEKIGHTYNMKNTFIYHNYDWCLAQNNLQNI